MGRSHLSLILKCVGMQVWSKQAVCKTDPSGSVVRIYSGAPIKKKEGKKNEIEAI